MKKTLLILAIPLLIISCGRKQYEVTESGILLFPADEQYGAVRISLLDADIAKVEISASDDFDTAQSLAALDHFEHVDFSVSGSGEEIVISTSKLKIRVDKKNGKVSFYDLKDRQILSEDKSSGEQFEPVNIRGVQGYKLYQRFNSPDQEALYGLGQHQADEINYKGKNEELFQYNTKVSIPFIVSTGNYGIYWDNYSLTRFGDPRPYSNLDQLTLYDKDGNEGGLTATYREDKDSDKIFIERKEKTIDYENLETIKSFPEGMDFNNAKVTWEGFIGSPEAEGIYRFLCYYAGYTRLWVDGELQFYKWRTAWNPSVAKFNVEMKPGEKHHLKIEWIPDGGISYLGLKVLSPTDPEAQDQIAFSSEMGTDIRYYFIAGENMDDVISGYRTVTGKAQVMPRWAMGFWQSRERYKTRDELLDVLGKFRDKHIPIDNIVLDWSYWPVDQWGSHEFDPERFPDPASMVEKVHELNARIMISVWPKFYINTEHYREFDAKGWMYKRAIQDSIRDWIYPGYIGSFYDAYDPGARQLFWEQIRDNIYDKGFDAWWLDATEPDILSNASVQYRKELMNPTALGPAEKYFNAYALMNAKGIYEGQRGVNNTDRVFILTRSGFAGIQRFGAVTWSGDIGTRWEDMKSQISAGINFALSGLPYWTMDIGGFCVEKRYERAEEGSEDLNEWRELNTRWYQFGAFLPLFRSHGQYPYREIFNIAPENHPAYKSMLYYDKLRYRLMPYIYSLAGMTWLNDYTIMRGLAMDFSSDVKTFDIGDQFMFGPAMMVNPVYEYGSGSRSVYLPESKGWYNAYSGKFLGGGQYIDAEAPYERIPLFIRSGSIIPFGPEIEYTSQKPVDPITLFVYSGDDGSFSLYEDEGTNYNYENGSYAIIPISWDDAGKTLTIGEREGKFEGMLAERTFRIRVVSQENEISIDTEEDADKEVTYMGEEVKVEF